MQPRIYEADEHHIRDHLIDPDALFVIRRLRDAGHNAYLVGGGVRDLLLNHQPKDFDVSTSAEPEEVRSLFRNCILIGRRFRLAHIRFGKKIIEVATFRSGDTESANLIVRDNQWGTPDEDALRRDFTINGLFYDPTNHRIIDYVGGFSDLEEHTLRVIGDPIARFTQDPVRMLRALKFQARFGFHLDPAAEAALKTCRQDIRNASAPRLLEEMLRMLESGASAPFFELMRQHGFFSTLFPFISNFFEASLESPTLFEYLEAADEYIKSRDFVPHRAVLATSLVFPALSWAIKEAEKEKGSPPTMGEVQLTSEELVLQAFGDTFITFPKRLRYEISHILETQFRFTPFSHRKFNRQTVAKHPEARLALGFLRLRTLVDSELEPLYEEWKEEIRNCQSKRPKKETSSFDRRRRRR